MKRYISLAGALLVGTVVAQQKKETSTKVQAKLPTEVAPVLKVAPATLAKAHVLYVSDNDSMSQESSPANVDPVAPNQSVDTSVHQTVNSETTAKDAVTSVETSVETIPQPANNDQSQATSVETSVETSAEVSIKDNASSATSNINGDPVECTSVETSTPAVRNNSPVSNKSFAEDKSFETSCEQSIDQAEQAVTSVDDEDVTVDENSLTSHDVSVESPDDEDVTVDENSLTSHDVSVNSPDDDGLTVDENTLTSHDVSVDSAESGPRNENAASYDTYTTPDEVNNDSVGTSEGTSAVSCESADSVELSKDSKQEYYSVDDHYSYDNYGAWKSKREVSNHEHVDDVDIDVQKENLRDHGFKGLCGKKVNVPTFHTFWCDDKQINLRTNCVLIKASEYKCCTKKNGCEDEKDFKTWNHVN